MSSHAELAFLLGIALLVAAFLVFRDARKHSSQSAPLWGLVVVFGGVLGVLLYLLLGRDSVSETNDYPFYDY